MYTAQSLGKFVQMQLVTFLAAGEGAYFLCSFKTYNPGQKSLGHLANPQGK